MCSCTPKIGEVALPGEAPGDIGDVLVHAEDLAHHQHHRQAAATGRRGAVGRQGKATHRHADLTDLQPRGIGGQGLRAHGQHGGGESRPDSGGHEITAAEIGRGRGGLEG